MVRSAGVTVQMTVLVLMAALCGSCGLSDVPGGVPGDVELPFETRFSFVNLSKQFYATIGVREHRTDNSSDYAMTPLLAPGALFREDFLVLVGNGCPDSVDLRLLLYGRTNDDVPIGLDEGEAVDASPIVAGELLGLPACNVEPQVTYTVVNWDAPDGTARVKIAQGSGVDTFIAGLGIFPNVDNAWELSGIAPGLSNVAAPALAETETIAGRVALADGTGIEGIGVLLRTQFRVRLTDSDESNDPDSGFGDPIAFTVTDATGAFSIDRPAGGYQVEFFSDDFSFRPASVQLETPIGVIQIIAEAL